MLGHKEDQGAARIHDLEMAENLVQEQRMNNVCVTLTHVQVRKKKMLIFLLREKSFKIWFNSIMSCAFGEMQLQSLRTGSHLARN